VKPDSEYLSYIFVMRDYHETECVNFADSWLLYH